MSGSEECLQKIGSKVTLRESKRPEMAVDSKISDRENKTGRWRKSVNLCSEKITSMCGAGQERQRCEVHFSHTQAIISPATDLWRVIRLVKREVGENE
jgi:hypothetical protein